MSVIVSKISQRLFDILKGTGQTLYLFDEEGTRVYDAKEARSFFTEPSNLMIIIKSGDDNQIKVFASSDFDILENKKLLDMIKKTATHYNMDYVIRKFGKKLSPKDFAALNESKMFGTSKSSYQKIGEVKLILRHIDKVNEESPGARSRKIRETFIEDSMGQRFRMPTNWLAGNRAIAKYINEGGKIYDDTGSKISKLTEQYVNLRNLFKITRNLNEHTEYSKNLMVNVYEHAENIKSIFRGLNTKTFYEDSIDKVNNINNILNETDNSHLVERILTELNIDFEDNIMRKIIESVAPLGIDEARRKKGVDFEVTPQIEKWAQILTKLDTFSSDDTDRLYGPEGEEIAHDDFLKQAKRIVDREITRFPGAKQAVPQKQLSQDPKIAQFQKKADYYATIAQYLSPVDDSILSNIISRLSDHYMYLVGDQKTTMPQNNPTFAYAENLADAVAKMVGVNKTQYESQMSISHEAYNSITEFFSNFSVDNIIFEEKKKETIKKKNEIKEKVNAIKESRSKKAKNLVEDQEKFFGMASKLAHFNEDPSKISKLTRYLSETQKRRLLSVVKGTWDRTVSENVAKGLGLLTEAKDGRKATSAMNSSDRMASSMDKVGSARQFALDKARTFVSKGMTPKQALERNNLPVTGKNLDYVRGGKELAQPEDKYAAMAKKYGIKEAAEAEKGKKATASVRKALLDKLGIVAGDGTSYREEIKGKETIVLSLKPSGKKKVNVKTWEGFPVKVVDYKSAKPLDETNNVFSGTVRNKKMFVEAITKQKGATYGKVAQHILEGKPFNKVKKSLLEGVADYALSKKEEELSGSILKVLTPVENTVVETAPEKSYIRVVVEGMFKDLTGEVTETEGDFYKVKLNDVIDEQVFHIDELDFFKDE